MMAGSPRYVRYILLALLCILLILFFSSSSEAPRQTYKSAADLLKESQSRWGNAGLKKEPISGYDAADEGDPLLKSGAHSASPKPDSAEGAPAGGKSQPVLAEQAGEQHAVSPNPLVGNTPLRLESKPTGPHMNATFVTLARNSDIWEIARSIRQVEDRFNHRFNYDWVFLNDAPFDESFKAITTALVSGTAKYGVIPKAHWSFPDWIDQERAKEVREDMAKRKIIYGDSVSYRHMCRYESGFFFRHELMLEYEWYWRVEPSIELFCDIKYDAFKFMAENKKKYSFVISLLEYIDTIPSLWNSTRRFIQNHPEHIVPGNSMAFLSDDGGETYNKCHFWSNFEIGNLNWLRSKAYIDFFESLDRDGGFFYERWGDAPVHSIAAGLMLKKEEIHFFEDIAYYHIPFTHCPGDEKFRAEHKCHCNPNNNFDWNGYSCTKKFFTLNNMPIPAIAEKKSTGTKSGKKP